MAGESPDSSKQRESSAEPTSGSTGPVPDPRSAVTRESSPEPRGGGVDTATKVLSVRDLITPSTRASEPEPTPDPIPEAPSKATPETPPKATPTTTTPEAASEATADAPDKATLEALSKATPKAATKEAASEATPEAPSKATPKAANKATPAAASETAPETASKADLEDASKADLEDPSRADVEDPSKADVQDPSKADVQDPSKATPQTAPQAASKAPSAPESPSEAPEPPTDAQDAADASSAPEPPSSTGTPAKGRPGAPSWAKSTAPAGRPAPKATDDSENRGAAADEPTADDHPKAEAPKPADPSKGARPGTAAPEDKPAGGRATGGGLTWAKPSAGPSATDKPANKPTADEAAVTDGEDTPQGPPAPDHETRTGGAGGKTTDEGAAEAADQPTADEAAVADGEDTPQGPPAPDHETRTGGAGGKTTDEGAAEAVDQPTAVFKAVRPPKPSVDQPTTMLKLTPEPKPEPKPEAPTEPERTSKFVPLKPPTPHTTHTPERTTQQPLPPKPPLDLLAELTNTPPPPPTPLRTLARRVKIWTPLIVLLAIVFAAVQSLRPVPTPTLDLTAQSTYTFEGDQPTIPWPASGQAALDVQGIGTFGSSGEQKPVPIASVAKVMTAYVLLRDHPMKSGEDGAKIKIDRLAEEQSVAGAESTVHVYEGDEITEREALQALLIASANNVARLVARWDAGSEEAFVEKMNAAARDLGMSNTTYTDPSGLNDTTVSTAVDQVKLGKAAMTQPVFREVAAMMEYYDYKGERWRNWNRLVGTNNVVGIKTGTTTSALGNLVFAAKQEAGGETRTIVGAVLRQPDVGGGILAAALDSSDKLIRAAQGALQSATILKKGDIVGHVDDGLGGRTPVVVTKDVTAAGWAGLEVELSFVTDDLPHSAKAGTQVGTLTVGDGGTSGAVKVPVALQTDLVEPGFMDKLTRMG
ncbi:D-alanyl-D-alanine carboxypeptidase [Streptomyces sp. NPDC018693]|uniref:D-alanyl-D-alanine carboxypeptidase n=1 Tax=unclassified Streptomyces TaxID=2593676 RepID=UPI0037978407